MISTVILMMCIVKADDSCSWTAQEYQYPTLEQCVSAGRDATPGDGSMYLCKDAKTRQILKKQRHITFLGIPLCGNNGWQDLPPVQ